MDKLDSSIYLLQLRESYERKEDIFKIGRTQQDNVGRFKDYPNGSKLLLHINCIDSIALEKHLIDVFSKTFQRCDRCKLYGSEYFKGDSHIMREIILAKINYTCSLEQSRLVEKTIQMLETENVKLKEDVYKLQNDIVLQNALDKIKDLEAQILKDRLYYENQQKINSAYLSSLENEFMKLNTNQNTNQCNEVQSSSSDENIVETNDTIVDDRVNYDEKICKKCNRVFSNKYIARNHERNCNGAHLLQCHKCMKQFKTKQGKYQHLKKVACVKI